MSAQETSAKVLLASCREWVSTAKLALALQSFGCEVHLLAPRRHPAVAAGCVQRAFAYRALWPVESLKSALRLSKPDVVIACDEVVQGQLLLLAEEDPAVAALMERSFGGAEARRLARSRALLLEAARGCGIAVPETLPVREDADVDRAADALGLPMMLKADASFGGQGVRLVESKLDAARAWTALHEAPGLVRALKRGVVDHEWNHVLTSLQQSRRSVSAQAFLPGSGGERTAMAVAVAGQMRACVVFDVVETWTKRGASSVLRLVDDPKVEESVRRMVERLGSVGLVGADFMLDPATGEFQMIEMNLRPTQLVHLPLGEGCDLVAEYVRGVLGRAANDRASRVSHETIALFPQELMRDENSSYVHGAAFHDVPWESPGLVAEMLRRSKLRVRPVDLQ